MKGRPNLGRLKEHEYNYESGSDVQGLPAFGKPRHLPREPLFGIHSAAGEDVPREQYDGERDELVDAGAHAAAEILTLVARDHRITSLFYSKKLYLLFYKSQV